MHLVMAVPKEMTDGCLPEVGEGYEVTLLFWSTFLLALLAEGEQKL